MHRNFHKTVALVAVIATLASGCRSTEEYKRLADAGNKYTHAVNELLTTAGNIRLEASSEQILKDDRLSNQSIDDYTQLSKLDDERLKILNDIRRHNLLLQAYFSKLHELANSNAPDEAKAEIEGISNNLNTIGQELRGSNLITNQGVFSSLASFVVTSQIRGALREELEKRTPEIILQLTLQQEMLNALRDSIQQDVKLIKLAREQRLIVRPLVQTDPISNEDEWIQTRKTILTMNRKIAELEAASAALGEFKEIFQAFVSGKLTSQRLNSVLKDIDSFLAQIESIK
jgi:hypothetical protein